MEAGISGYAPVRLLGSGQFGDVYLVSRLCDGKLFAAKVSRSVGALTSAEIREAQLMQQLRHPNIVQYEDLVHLNGRQQCAIIMEYAGGGDLAVYMNAHATRNQLVPEEEIMRLLIQMASALSHMHDQRVLHRDLKPQIPDAIRRNLHQNILLDNRGIAKLSDFGVARSLQHTFDAAKTLTGTPYYMAPELLDNLPYDAKADIWSLGCVIFELARLAPPFKAPSFAALVLQITSQHPQPIPTTYSLEFRELAASMLHKDPAKRPDARAILQDRLVQRWLLHFAGSAPSISMLTQESESAEPQPRSQCQDAVVAVLSGQRELQCDSAPRVEQAGVDDARQMFFENQAAARRNKGRVEREKAAPAVFLSVEPTAAKQPPVQRISVESNAHQPQMKEKLREYYLENARAARAYKQRALDEMAEPRCLPLPSEAVAVHPTTNSVGGRGDGQLLPPPPPTKSVPYNYEELLEEERRRVRMERKLLQERMRGMQATPCTDESKEPSLCDA